MKTKFNARRYFQVLGITLGVMLIGTLACLGINYSAGLGGGDVDNTATVAAYGGKINVLLMCTDVDGLRTDAIMLASYDTETKQVKILSIPRDTKLYVGNRYQKINAAHAYMKDGVIGGPTATCEAVNRITGIPINYYVDFSFDAVAHVIDELGPIEFTIPDLYGDGVGMVYDDPVQSLHIDLPPGDYQLNGQQAVWVMRYRHGNAEYNPETGRKEFKGYPNGDMDRMEMQQKLIKAIVDQKVNAAMILKVPAIFQAITSEIKTNFTAKDIIKYSKYLSGFSSANIISYELPGEYGHDSSNGDVWEVDIEKTKELVRTEFGYDAEGITIDNPADKSSKTDSSEKASEKKAETEKKTTTEEKTEKKQTTGETSSSKSNTSSQSKSSTSSSASNSSSNNSSSSSSSSNSSSSNSSSSNGGSSSSTSSGSSSSSSTGSGSQATKQETSSENNASSSSSSNSSSSSSSSTAVKTKDLDDE